MSSDQSLDPQLIEQTKQQIRTLVSEIAQFSKSEMAPEEFYAELLPRVVSALAAIGGVVWSKDDQGRLALQYQINLQETKLPAKSEEEQLRHARLLHKVMTTGEGFLVPPQSGTGEADQAANPTDFLLVLGALKTEIEVVGAIEIFQRPESGPSTQKGYLRFLVQMCDLAGDFLKGRQLRHFSDRQVLWTQLEEFSRLVHASLNPRDTAYTIANEGRRLIECDRVSVAIRKGNRSAIEAVSGQDLLDKRSNTVRLLGRLATVVVASGEPVWYTGDTSNMAPQVEDAIQEYVDESHTKALAVLPLQRPQVVEKEKERPDEPDETPPPVGALVVEQIEDSRVPQKMFHRVEVVCQHSATALANALEHESLFLMPVWRTLGKTRLLTRARTLPKVLLGAGAAMALVVALVLVPAELKMKCDGSLEPIERRNVYAGAKGTVEEVLVAHGESVRRMQPLVRLRSYEIEQELIRSRGDLRVVEEDLRGLQSQAINPQPGLEREGTYPEGRESELYSKMAEQEEHAKKLREEIRVLEKQNAELLVCSPVDGYVITWDPDNRLKGRSAPQGSQLLQVADADKGWYLLLRMPDDRMGHILRAQHARYAELRGRLGKALRENLRDAVRQRLRAELKAQAESSPGLRVEAASAVSQEVQGEPASGTGNVVQPRTEAGQAGGEGVPRHPEPTPSEPGSQEAPPAEAPQPDPDVEIDRQVDAQLPERLDAEAQAALGKVPDEELRKQLFDLTGEDVEDRLPVQYYLASAPGVKCYGWVQEIGRAAEVRGDEGNTVPIKVAIQSDDISLEEVRQGTTVKGSVACGPRSLGYVIFHDLYAWVQKMWFRWF